MTCILVVCTGNICRSPIAEGVLRAEFRRRLGERAPEVISAGTAGWEGSPAVPESVDAAAERGADISDHVAHRLGSTDIGRADLIVGMSSEHREDVIRSAPGAAPKTFTLKELVRLLEELPPVDAPASTNADTSWMERVRQAHELRGRGFPGNPQDEDVADPLGLPFESFRAVAWDVDEWCARLVDALLGKAPARAGIRDKDE
ncbi:MAG: low molecular weight phosphatase family protein [Actinomycetota bacterium]|nr:low molecular weight phosphatase family protein [Actinomycetota bacterium]